MTNYKVYFQHPLGGISSTNILAKDADELENKAAQYAQKRGWAFKQEYDILGEVTLAA